MSKHPIAPDTALDFASVRRHEQETIRDARAKREPRDRPIDETDTTPVTDTVGLALSGGGIRSATFNLGVLQALADLGVLKRLDYLSTVSGGGYIGTWLTAWIRRCGLPEVEHGLTVGPDDDEPRRPIHFLREYSNYLTPKLGLASGDTWAFIGGYLRNLFINLTILGFGLSVLMLLPYLLALYTARLAMGPPKFLTVGLAVLLAILGLRSTLINLPVPREAPADEITRGLLELPGAIYRRVVAPTIAAIWLLWTWWWSLWWAPKYLSIPGPPAPPASRWICALYGAAGFAGIWLVSGIAAEVYRRRSAAKANKGEGETKRQRNPLWLIVKFALWAAISGGVGTLIAWPLTQSMVQHAADGTGMPAWRIVGLGVALAVALILAVQTLHIALAGRLFSADGHEWWGRLGGILGWLTLVVTVVSIIALDGPWLVAWLGQTGAKWLTGGWATITSLALALAKRSEKPNEPAGLFRRVIFAIAPPVFVLGLLLLMSVVVFHTVSGLTDLVNPLHGLLERTKWAMAWLGGWPPNVAAGVEPWAGLAKSLDGLLWVYIVGFFACALLISWRTGINRFSMHALYRHRLVRCYLGATHERKPHQFTGMDPHDDDVAFNDLNGSGKHAHAGPYHIYNTTLNLVNTQNLAWQQRKGASFVFTPAYAGYEFRDQNGTTISAFRKTLPLKGLLNLGGAMAISGAAASPNMGAQSSGGLAFLMTVFNVRLGSWLANPLKRPFRQDRLEPGSGFLYLFNELMGRTNHENNFVYLSDGGHFENLGLYELVRRHCRYIIVSDAGEDHALTFGDLGNAIEKVRTDFGVDIDIDIEPLRRCESGASKWHCAVGTIHYQRVAPESPDGILLYLKTTLTGNEPTDVQRYAAHHPEFPHNSTVDQWFDESQFESYRELGRHVGSDTIGAVGDRAEVERWSSEELFVKLREHWYPPSHFVQTSFTKHTATYTVLLEKLRSDKLLEFLDPQVFPEWPQLMPQNRKTTRTLGGWSLRDDLPDSPEKRRAAFYFCNQIIQLMEDAYLDLNLEAEFFHPDNRGWLNLMRHWSWSGMFRATWAISSSIYGARFQRFCERRLDLKPGELWLREPLRCTEAMKLDRESQDERIFWERTIGDSGIGFWEAQLIKVVLTHGPARDIAPATLDLIPLKMTLGTSKETALEFNVGFAMLQILTKKRARIVYFRVQDHVRKTGLARGALKRLVETYSDGLTFDQVPLQMPEGLSTPADARPEEAFPNAAAIAAFTELLDSVQPATKRTWSPLDRQS